MLQGFLLIAVGEQNVTIVFKEFRSGLLFVVDSHLDVELRHGVFFAHIEHPSVGVEIGRIGGILHDGFGAHAFRLIQIAIAQCQEIGIIIQCARIIGIEVKRLVVESEGGNGVAHGKFHVSLARQQIGAVVHLRAIQYGKRFIINLNCLIVLLHAIARRAEIGIKFHIIGVQTNRFIAHFNGLLIVAGIKVVSHQSRPQFFVGGVEIERIVDLLSSAFIIIDKHQVFGIEHTNLWFKRMLLNEHVEEVVGAVGGVFRREEGFGVVHKNLQFRFHIQVGRHQCLIGLAVVVERVAKGEIVFRFGEISKTIVGLILLCFIVVYHCTVAITKHKEHLTHCQIVVGIGGSRSQ